MAFKAASKDLHALSLLMGLRLRGTYLRAGACVNRELIRYFWQAGEDLQGVPSRPPLSRRWLSQLSAALSKQAIQKRYFSPANLGAMREFRRAWPDQALVFGTLCELSWDHHLILLKIPDPQRRRRLALQALRASWSPARLAREAKA